jgi:Tol biopolymer transport system component
MNQPHFNFFAFKSSPPCPLLRSRRQMRVMLASLILLLGLVSQAWASFPVSATLNASDTQPLSWIGTAMGPASATSTPVSCREGIDCDTFILTIGGAPTDWTGKIALIRIDWQLPTSNFDVYVLRENFGTLSIVNQSVNGVLGGLTSETVSLSPSASGTGRYLVRVMYTQANFQDQYTAVANVVNLLRNNGRIVFERSYGGFNRNILSMNSDGSNQVVIAGNNFSPVYSPDGTKIACFRQEKFNLALFVMDAFGNNQTKVGTLVSPAGLPAWSPDGSRILFTDLISSNNGEIFVVPADGSTPPRPLSLNIADDYSPSWSPDGSRIVFLSSRPGTYRAIFVMNADGSNQTQLTNTNTYFPAWSPDGTKILFVSPTTSGYNIFVMNPDGSGQTRLTTSSEMDWNPVWSPDGTRIAFERGSFIYTMNANGSSQTKLSIDGGNDSEPAWSPDGTRILFKSFRDDLEGIFVMDATGASRLDQLTTNGYDDNYDWQAQ